MLQNKLLQGHNEIAVLATEAEPVWASFPSLHFFVPRMLAQGSEGHIVNTASAFGLVSSSGAGIYKVSKHGIVTLSEMLALELAAHAAKLKASVLCPEFVNTRITDAERNRPPASEHAPGEQQSNAYQLWRAFRQHGETALSVSLPRLDAQEQQGIRQKRSLLI